MSSVEKIRFISENKCAKSWNRYIKKLIEKFKKLVLKGFPVIFFILPLTHGRIF